MKVKDSEKKMNFLIILEIITFALVVYLFNISKFVVANFGSWQAPGIPALYRFLFWFLYFPGMFFHEKGGPFGFLFFWMSWPLTYYLLRKSFARTKSFMFLLVLFAIISTGSLLYLYVTGGMK